MTRTDETEAILRQAFMWGTLVSPLAASRIAARVGAERLFGAGVLGAGIVAVMVPAAWLTACHVGIRFVQGIFMVNLAYLIFNTQYTFLITLKLKLSVKAANRLVDIFLQIARYKY